MTVEEKKILHPHHLRNFMIILAVPIVIAVVIAWRGGLFRLTPKIVMITSTSDPYWDRVILGAKAAGQHFDVDVTEVRVNGDEQKQSQAVHDALASGHNGLGISPVNPLSQTVMLSEIAGKASLVTFDSDCPAAPRLGFVGTDNYVAGRQAAAMVRDVLPDGGDIIISVGSMEKENGKVRRQGLIDNLLDRPMEPGRTPDPADAELKGSKYSIVATLIDNVDIPKVTTLAVDAIKKYPNAKCFVGLYGYSTPALLEALKQTGKLGQIKLIGFDEADATLAGIEAGQVYGTLVQDQYNMGYDTVRFLVESMRHTQPSDVGTRMEYLPCRPVVGVEDVRIIRYEKAHESNPDAPLPGQSAEPASSQPGA